MGLVNCIDMANKWAGFAVFLLFVVGTAGTGIGMAIEGGRSTEPAAGPGLPQLVGEGPVEVTQCREVAEPGRYILTEDIENSTVKECITIVASDVVFDGQGHTLDAADIDHQNEGIAAGYTDPSIENVTIQNLVVTDWSQGVGCRSVAANVTISNVTARHNGLRTRSGDGYSLGQDRESDENESEETYAIYVGDGTHNVTISESLVVGNSLGILLTNTSNNLIQDNVIRNNSGGAISLFGETWQNRILDNRIVSNGGSGIFVGERHPGGPENSTRIRNNALLGNARGMFVQNVNTRVLVTANSIRNTSNESLWVAVVDSNVTIGDNVIRSGGDHGIVVDATDNVMLRNNSIKDVAGTGIFLKYESRGNVLENNSIHGARRGLRVTDTSGQTVIRGLTVGSSQTENIVFAGSGNNTLGKSTVRGPGSIVVDSAGNRLRNVTLDSGRISLEGTDIRLSSVADIPGPPRGLYRVGVGVTVRRPGDALASVEPATLTVYYPAATHNVSLWRWSDTGTWKRLANTTGHTERSAITTTLRQTGEFLVVPLSTVPFATPTPSDTPTPTRGPPETGSTTSTPPTVTVTPGFGVSIALLALVLIVLDPVGSRR